MPFLYCEKLLSTSVESLVNSAFAMHVRMHAVHESDDSTELDSLWWKKDSISIHYLNQFFFFTERARKTGGKVLVHCQAGVSRSATITISYILRKTKLNAYDAYKFVKSKRDVVSPNLNFMGQLMTFEEALNKGEIDRQLSPPIIIQ